MKLPDFHREKDPYRLYALIRVDLDMSPGKAASQAGHAYVDCYALALERHPERVPLWKRSHGIKITLAAPGLDSLLRAKDLAEASGLPCSLIIDAGWTVFGEPTITALGIGPARRAEVEHITGRFGLYK